MNVRDLLDRLSDLDPEAEVRIASQPAWPLQTSVRGIATASDLRAGACDEHGEHGCDDCDPTSETEVVWLVEGSEPADASPYAPRGLWEVAS